MRSMSMQSIAFNIKAFPAFGPHYSARTVSHVCPKWGILEGWEHQQLVRSSSHQGHRVCNQISFILRRLSSPFDCLSADDTPKSALLLREWALWRKFFSAHTTFVIVFIPLMIATILVNWVLRHNRLLASANTCWTQHSTYMFDGHYDLGIWANSRREERIEPELPMYVHWECGNEEVADSIRTLKALGSTFGNRQRVTPS